MPGQITLSAFKTSLYVCGMMEQVELNMALTIEDSNLFMEHFNTLRNSIGNSFIPFEDDANDNQIVAFIPLVIFRHRICNSLGVSGKLAQKTSELLELLFDSTKSWDEIGADIICLRQK